MAVSEPPRRTAHRRAVFLDRDGVLNRAIVRNGRPHPPARLAELEILPGVEDACRRLKAAGFLLVVVTNQPDIARGTARSEDVETINAVLRDRLALDEFAVCPHDDHDDCGCRKPKPGLLTAAAERHGLDMTASVMVGDRWRDVAAGRAAGCRTVFIDYGYDEPPPSSPDFVTSSLAESLNFILALEFSDGRTAHVAA